MKISFNFHPAESGAIGNFLKFPPDKCWIKYRPSFIVGNNNSIIVFNDVNHIVPFSSLTDMNKYKFYGFCSMHLGKLMRKSLCVHHVCIKNHLSGCTKPQQIKVITLLFHSKKDWKRAMRTKCIYRALCFLYFWIYVYFLLLLTIFSAFSQAHRFQSINEKREKDTPFMQSTLRH